ncbi:unnamed protein product [Vicia faba]|uniref:PPPDE domain-containing protein n=1 Tax=Vicia faba TaxID=3906 RepID=A0AAV0YMB5_VICFA|nr:unnamed protein product [Vicia faba]
MGTKSNFNSTSQSQRENTNNKNNNTTNVVLNVYDLTPLNNYLYWLGFGIFHSGIQVHGKEYGFGAHDFPSSGVFEVEPRKCPGFMYRTSVPLGQVNMHPSEFRTFIENMASRLTGKRLPGWVNRLARIGSLCSCLLPDSIQVTTVKQLPEYHSEDEVTDSLSTATPGESMELDAEQAKCLLSPLATTEDVAFVKEAQVK